MMPTDSCTRRGGSLYLSAIFLLFSLLTLFLAACGGGNSGEATTSANSDAAARAVERYLTAKVASDADVLRELLCSPLESAYDREASSFASVEARIEGMSCSSASSTADGTIVQCEGKIVATYDARDEDFLLDSYLAVQEDGDWKWCGEAG